ncbi:MULTISPECIES: NAD(P)-dependent oxidoreductase [unclassified Rhizobacter]|uniref:NAD(P)-dependent oxidoreductase n=1 Tax=unclassified Rhizobacter TaxID=2640088 RepID=UPI0006F6AB7D|nr:MULTISPECIES: NAD(P)-dependent oxidoreductase [unclassified Rhizobacter]KQU81366.1 3-beta hydroxysteroid dehydrogenase [Rhizobacter sp. Root29]KQW09282.1 3-beta hydroxysteroid dehydrogenase [Rhizobacter sp. Root1238]KRB18110.1 3-beta hydroxysteroid dehydrogenase [Rhizobacter sp. Root16D2]
MKIALIGATGFVGSEVLKELLSRGHQVTALARHPDKLAGQLGLKVVKADALDAAQVAAAVEGHDAVVDSYNPGWSEPRIHDLFLQGTRAILDGVKRSGVKRVLVVGGAGSLFVAPGVQLVDTPHFPAEYKQGALAAREALNQIRGETALDWTFLSPAALLAPGPRTGKFRIGAEELLMDGDKPAGLSVADLAVAIVDEIETPKHIRKRFTAAY